MPRHGIWSPTERRIPSIATEDIGAEVAALLTSEWTGCRVIELGSMVSPDEIAAQLGDVLGFGAEGRSESRARRVPERSSPRPAGGKPEKRRPSRRKRQFLHAEEPLRRLCRGRPPAVIPPSAWHATRHPGPAATPSPRTNEMFVSPMDPSTVGRVATNKLDYFIHDRRRCVSPQDYRRSVQTSCRQSRSGLAHRNVAFCAAARSLSTSRTFGTRMNPDATSFSTGIASARGSSHKH